MRKILWQESKITYKSVVLVLAISPLKWMKHHHLPQQYPEAANPLEADQIEKYIEDWLVQDNKVGLHEGDRLED